VFEKSKAKKAEAAYQTALATWQHEHDELSAILETARTRSGQPSATVMLKKGEAVFATIGGVGLVEMRRGAGHYAGHSQGVSIPIGSLGGRSVRYRVGVQKGHFVQGAPQQQSVDQGQLIVTNQRLVFLGKAKTIECLFAKLVSIQQGTGEISVSVSNRQKPTVIHYGAALDGWMQLRLALALAISRGEAEQFAVSIEQNLSELETEKPQPPTA